MDRPIRILVSARFKGVNERLVLNFKFEPKPENLKKPKSLNILKLKNWLKDIMENMLHIQKNLYLESV